MIDIKTQYAGLTLRNPLIVGSSGLTNNAERNKEFEKAGAGAIVLKSLFEEQIEMQSDVLMQESDYPEAADYIRGYVKANQINIDLSLWMGNGNIQSNLEIIKAAMQESRLLTFEYIAHHGNKTARTAEPYQLVLKSSH